MAHHSAPPLSIAAEPERLLRPRLETDIRHAVLGNGGTLLAFRLGPEDAAFIAREFEPYLDHLDLLNLPNHHAYVKLMADGAPMRPFGATTVPWQQVATAFADEQAPTPPDTDVRYYVG